MPHIDVSRPHDLGREGARRAAEEVVGELRGEPGVSFRSHWEGDTLVASGRGFDARVHAGPDAVRVTADLGLVLRPLRGTLRQQVERYLDRYVGSAA